VAFGFTTLDVPLSYKLSIDSQPTLSYIPISGVQPATIQSSAGTSVDNTSISGAIDSSYVSVTDLKAGRYDDSTEVTIFKVNYNSLGDGEIVTFRGYIGEITIDDIVYKVESLAQLNRVKKNIGISTQPTCRVKRFCDQQCGLSAAAYTFTGLHPQAGVSAYSLTLNLTSDTHATGFYTYGIVTCTSGPNVGFEREIKTHTNSGSVAQLTLKEAFPFAISTGDTFSMIAGCDRAFGTCAGTYNNAANFRGEPHLPGNATLIKIGAMPKGH
jgi:uncharacterized phage protein (TIGR02218 family)